MHVCVWIGSQITALPGPPCGCGERVPSFRNKPSQDTNSLFLDSKYQSVRNALPTHPVCGIRSRDFLRGGSLWYSVT